MPKTKQDLSKVSQLRISEKTYDEIEKLAIDDDRPMANMIRVLLDEALYYRRIGMSKTMAKNFLSKLGMGRSD